MKTYQDPTLTVILLSNEDVLTASVIEGDLDLLVEKGRSIFGEEN